MKAKKPRTHTLSPSNVFLFRIGLAPSSVLGIKCRVPGIILADEIVVAKAAAEGLSERYSTPVIHLQQRGVDERRKGGPRQIGEHEEAGRP